MWGKTPTFKTIGTFLPLLLLLLLYPCQRHCGSSWVDIVLSTQRVVLCLPAYLITVCTTSQRPIETVSVSLVDLQPRLLHQYSHFPPMRVSQPPPIVPFLPVFLLSNHQASLGPGSSVRGPWLGTKWPPSGPPTAWQGAVRLWRCLVMSPPPGQIYPSPHRLSPSSTGRPIHQGLKCRGRLENSSSSCSK